VFCHVGTERPAETLDVTLRELVRIGEGFEQDELDRCKARAKSSLIMQQESTLARSSSIARDWFHLGRVTTLAEVGERINALTVDSVLDYVHSHPAGNFTVMTIGPEAVEVPVEFS
jgi:predicted Zn-dependent peptidase